MQITNITIGSKEKHDAFVIRHEEFFNRFPNLLAAEEAALGRTLNANPGLDPILFYLGTRCKEDFTAITLLAAHGLGLSATSLIRGMYERVVTAVYLHNNPKDWQLFADFDVIQKRRAALAIKETIGIDPHHTKRLEDLEAEYALLKTKYEVSVCKTCDTTRVGPSWHKLDFVTMAKSLPYLRELLVPGYYVPLSQAHSTLRSVASQIEERGDGITFRTDYTEECDRAFKLAHQLLLHILQLQADHFKIPEIDARVTTALHDYTAIWNIYPT
jgi:hypothetical protein